MPKGLCLALAALALPLVAPAAAAQATQPRHDAVVVSNGGRNGAGYTGMRISGRPSPAPDGAPRWAEHPVVSGVEPGSPAHKVGIANGDVLLVVNGVDARDPRTLFGNPGKTFAIRLRRGTAVREFVLTSVAAPAGDGAPARN